MAEKLCELKKKGGGVSQMKIQGSPWELYVGNSTGTAPTLPTFPSGYGYSQHGITDYNVEEFSKVKIKAYSLSRGTSGTFARLWYIADGTAVSLSDALYSNSVPSDLASGVEIDVSNISTITFATTTNNHVCWTIEITFE